MLPQGPHGSARPPAASAIWLQLVAPTAPRMMPGIVKISPRSFLFIRSAPSYFLSGGGQTVLRSRSTLEPVGVMHARLQGNAAPNQLRPKPQRRILDNP